MFFTLHGTEYRLVSTSKSNDSAYFRGTQGEFAGRDLTVTLSVLNKRIDQARRDGVNTITLD